MNRIFAAVAALAIIGMSAAAPAKADDAAVLSKIETANSKVETIQAHFIHRKTLVATAKVTSMEGTLYFSSPDKMGMHYTKPATDLLIINGNQFYMNRGRKASTFDTDKNALMRSLSQTLIRCVRGEASQVATDNNADISTSSSGSNYVVTLTAKKNSPKGYSKIVLKYRKSDCMLVSMEMTEFIGVVNLYEMSDIKTGVSVDASVYTVPSK